jgi:putative nucleotidyltransferase with HDIG domain
MKDIKDVLKKINKLPPMPEVVSKMLRISHDTAVSAKEVVELVKYDQSITANVLRLCNSSYYSLPRNIASLNEAVVMLGNKTLYNIIFASFSEGMLNKKNEGYLMEKGNLWKHSLSCAILAKEIALKVNYKDEQLAYSAGLMHDVGKMVLDDFILENSDAILKKVREQDTDFNEIEEDIIGISHAEAGAILAENWKFPKAIISAIGYHHTPDKAKEDEDVVCIVHIADALSFMFGFGDGIDGLAYHLSDNALKKLNLTEKDLYKLSPFLINEIKRAEDMLAS